MQYIYEQSHFDAPFFLTYTCNSLFALYLPLVGGVDLARAAMARGPGLGVAAALDLGRSEDGGVGMAAAAAAAGGVGTPLKLEISTNVQLRKDGSVAIYEQSPQRSPPHRRVDSSDNSGANAPPPLPPSQMTVLATLKASAVVCPIWFLANFTYNFSLRWTSISSNTILSSTSSIWTFVLSVLVLREDVTLSKIIGVVLAVFGSSCVGLSSGAGGDDASGSATSMLQRVAGGLVCVLSACLYGCYTTAIRRMLPDERTARMPLFFGLIGAINATALLPIVLVLHFTGVESLSTLTFATFGWIALKGIADNVVSDLLWAYAVLLTTPTVATLGVSLTIPGAIILDSLLGSPPTNPLLYVGAVLVIAGFVSVNFGNIPWMLSEGKCARGQRCFAALNVPLSRAMCCAMLGCSGCVDDDASSSSSISSSISSSSSSSRVSMVCAMPLGSEVDMEEHLELPSSRQSRAG